jgi:hypothetical protein
MGPTNKIRDWSRLSNPAGDECSLDWAHDRRSQSFEARERLFCDVSLLLSMARSRLSGVQHTNYQVPAMIDDPEIGAAPHCNPLVKSKSTLRAPAIMSNAKTPVARSHSNNMGC